MGVVAKAIRLACGARAAVSSISVCLLKHAVPVLEPVDQSDVHSEAVELGIVDVTEFIDRAIDIRGEE